MQLPRTRAAILSAAMNLGAVERVDLLRYLRVPAIHFVIRALRVRGVCRERGHRPIAPTARHRRASP